MRTDKERLEMALDFAYQKDLPGMNQKDLRAGIDTFLGSTPADHHNLDADNLWPNCPGGGGVSVSVSGPIQMSEFTPVSLLAFQKKVLNTIQEAVVEAVEIKMAVDGEDYTLSLPAGHGGGGAEVGKTTWRVVGDGVNKVFECYADPVDAYVIIVGLLATGNAKLRQCAAPDCPQAFVRQGRRQYCKPECSQRTRNRKYVQSHRAEVNRKKKEARSKAEKLKKGES